MLLFDFIWKVESLTIKYNACNILMYNNCYFFFIIIMIIKMEFVMSIL